MISRCKFAWFWFLSRSDRRLPQRKRRATGRAGQGKRDAWSASQAREPQRAEPYNRVQWWCIRCIICVFPRNTSRDRKSSILPVLFSHERSVKSVSIILINEKGNRDSFFKLILTKLEISERKDASRDAPDCTTYTTVGRLVSSLSLCTTAPVRRRHNRVDV